ncbi:Uncharacterised protein [Mycobacteroides abscessus subsp. abscessus]|nr:Uncharacterised protein [Mycobacteroides abscessus subsp. abscessus]
MGGIDAFGGQQRGQFALAAYRLGGQQRDDARLPPGSGIGRVRGSHRRFSSNHTSSAFWACRRFSASSHTALRGPSITPSVIS